MAVSTFNDKFQILPPIFVLFRLISYGSKAINEMKPSKAKCCSLFGKTKTKVSVSHIDICFFGDIRFVFNGKEN